MDSVSIDLDKPHKKSEQSKKAKNESQSVSGKYKVKDECKPLSSATKFKCKYCTAFFSHNYNCKRHENHCKRHENHCKRYENHCVARRGTEEHLRKCICHGCDLSFKREDQLITHLRKCSYHKLAANQELVSQKEMPAIEECVVVKNCFENLKTLEEEKVIEKDKTVLSFSGSDTSRKLVSQKKIPSRLNENCVAAYDECFEISKIPKGEVVIEQNETVSKSLRFFRNDASQNKVSNKKTPSSLIENYVVGEDDCFENLKNSKEEIIVKSEIIEKNKTISENLNFSRNDSQNRSLEYLQIERMLHLLNVFAVEAKSLPETRSLVDINTVLIDLIKSVKINDDIDFRRSESPDECSDQVSSESQELSESESSSSDDWYYRRNLWSRESKSERDIRNRHDRGMCMSDNDVKTKVLDNIWKVRSATDETIIYVVNRRSDSCRGVCSSQCDEEECENLCDCLFSCSCPDDHELCKHIHKVQSFLNDRGESNVANDNYLHFYYKRQNMYKSYEYSRQKSWWPRESKRERDIENRHTRGMCMQDSSVIEKLPNTVWKVRSATDKSIAYIVYRCKSICNRNYCSSKCPKSECHDLCGHLFSCNCPDSNVLCKHIHKLQSFITRVDKKWPNLLESVQTNCMQIRQFVQSKIVPVNDINYITHVLSVLLRNIQSTKNVEQSSVNPQIIDATLVSTSNEKVKNERSQLSTFRKTPKGKHGSESSVPNQIIDATLVSTSNEMIKTERSQLSTFRKTPKGKLGSESSVPNQIIDATLVSTSNEMIKTERSQLSTFRKTPKRKLGSECSIESIVKKNNNYQ